MRKPALPARARGIASDGARFAIASLEEAVAYLGSRRLESAALRRHDPECTVFLQPHCALIAHQRAANLSGVVAQAGLDDFETFRVLVPAEPVSQEHAHAVD